MSKNHYRRAGRPSESQVAAAARAAKGEYDRFMGLPDAEKTREAEEMGRLDSTKDSRPLTKPERELWRRAKRGLGRPKRGRGAKPVNVTIERGLLDKADAFARRNGLTRSQIIAKGLVLAMAG